MKRSDPLPRQKDALRLAVPIAAAKPIPARSIDLLIELQQQKQLLGAIAPSFLTRNEFAVIARRLDLEGKGCQSRRAIAKELEMSVASVLDYEREALKSIDQHFKRALATYERENFIERRSERRRSA